MAVTTSGLYTAIAVLAALWDRRSTGRVAAAHIAMIDVTTELMGYTLHFTRHSGVEQQPVGMGSPAVAPYGAFRTSDGQTVVLGTTNDVEWQRLARELIGLPDLADDPRLARAEDRVAHRGEVEAAVPAWCAAHDLASVQAAADRAGIGNSRYNTANDVLEHPHLEARGRWAEVGTPNGPVPALGAHTGAVLAELGISAAELAVLREDGIVGA